MLETASPHVSAASMVNKIHVNTVCTNIFNFSNTVNTHIQMDNPGLSA